VRSQIPPSRVVAQVPPVAPLGVSLVLCCFNSASRLPDAFARTLASIAAQRTRSGFAWELIVVDNASRDDTAEFARRRWPKGHPVELQVISEPRAGLSYANQRGLDDARYEFVALVDDDNWVASDWVDSVAKSMLAHRDAGAIGGSCVAVCESAPPAWLANVTEWLAVGPQVREGSDLTDNPGVLRGAGLAVRKSAWVGLRDRGFRFTLPNRQGTALSASGDYELCLALRLAGWRLRYEPRMQFRHFLPAARLNWEYMRALARGAGESSVGLDPYFCALRKSRADRSFLKRLLEPVRATWGTETALTAGALARYALIPEALRQGTRNDLLAQFFAGRLSKLVDARRRYRVMHRQVADANWRHNSRMSAATIDA
jgi:glycosyltransferase involved in cell wall biosynthesis